MIIFTINFKLAVMKFVITVHFHRDVKKHRWKGFRPDNNQFSLAVYISYND